MSLIAYRNRADSAVITADTATVVDPAYPLSNLKLRDSGKVARLTPLFTGATPIVVDFGTPVQPRFIGLFGINRTVTGSGVTVERSTNGSSWTAVSATTEAIDASATEVPKDAKLLFGAVGAYRYWRFTFNWAYTGFRQIARPWFSTAADVVEFPAGSDAAWTLDVDDSGAVDQTPDGVLYEDKGIKLRSARLDYSVNDTVKTFGFADGDTSLPLASSLQDMQMHLGNTGECVVLPRLGRAWLHRIGFRGRFPDGISIAHQSSGYYRTQGRALEER